MQSDKSITVNFDKSGTYIYSMFFSDLFETAATAKRVKISGDDILKAAGKEKVLAFFAWLNSRTEKNFEFSLDSNYVLYFDDHDRLYAIRQYYFPFYVPQQEITHFNIPRFVYYFIRSHLFTNLFSEREAMQ